MNFKDVEYRISGNEFEILVVRDHDSGIFQTFIRTGRKKHPIPFLKDGVWLVAPYLEDILPGAHEKAFQLAIEFDVKRISKSKKSLSLKFPKQSFVRGSRDA